MKTSIAIVSYHKNSFNIPTILEFARHAKHRGIKILLFSKLDQEYPPEEELDNVEMVYIPRQYDRDRFTIREFAYFLKLGLKLWKANTQAIIGVDATGLVTADLLRKFIPSRVKMAYMSFELFFRDEPHFSSEFQRLKQLEINTCRKVGVIVIQDEYRKKLLENENSIDAKTKWALIPVAPSSVFVSGHLRSHYREKLKIPNGKIAIVTSGSIGTWSGLDLIMDAIKALQGDDYWFIIHDRIGFVKARDELSQLIQLHDAGYPVSVSTEPFNNSQEYYEFLKAFDLGLGLYVSLNNDPYNGKNIKEIGLASGKLSTFMMVGLPVIFSNSSPLTKLNGQYHFGYSCNENQELSSVIRQISTEGLNGKSDNAQFVYNNYLNPDSGIEQVLNLLN